MIRRALFALFLPAFCAAEIRWTEIKVLGLEGQGWQELKHPYDRLPAKAEGVVRGPVWSLAEDSAGLLFRFQSDATELRAQWTLRKSKLALPHMPATGVSGLDLYVLIEGRWRWLANGRPEKFPLNESTLVTGLEPKQREFMLYLPLYNGVDSVKLGIPTGAKFAPVSRTNRKPIVFYGSSILQGGCAARPGMAYPAIIGRMLDAPIINLGFSGNGMCEPEMADLLAELDPSVYVFDGLPNLSPEQAVERVEPLLAKLRKAHPKTPIVLVENVLAQGSLALPSRKSSAVRKNETLRSIFSKRSPDDPNLFYVSAAFLFGDDDEATVDGVHPTDLGFQRMAEAIAPAVRQALERTK